MAFLLKLYHTHELRAVKNIRVVPACMQSNWNETTLPVWSWYQQRFLCCCYDMLRHISPQTRGRQSSWTFSLLPSFWVSVHFVVVCHNHLTNKRNQNYNCHVIGEYLLYTDVLTNVLTFSPNKASCSSLCTVGRGLLIRWWNYKEKARCRMQFFQWHFHWCECILNYWTVSITK